MGFVLINTSALDVSEQILTENFELNAQGSVLNLI